MKQVEAPPPPSSSSAPPPPAAGDEIDGEKSQAEDEGVEEEEGDEGGKDEEGIGIGEGARALIRVHCEVIFKGGMNFGLGI